MESQRKDKDLEFLSLYTTCLILPDENAASLL